MPRCLSCSQENCGYRGNCSCECHTKDGASSNLWTNLTTMLVDIQQHVKSTGDKVVEADSPGAFFGYQSGCGRVWKIPISQAMFGHERLNELVVRDAFKTRQGREALTKVLNGEPWELLKPLDDDIPEMSMDQLKAEVQKLRTGIRQHRDSTDHNLCWHVPELWGLLPDKVEPKPQVPPRAEFLQKCAEYHTSLVRKPGQGPVLKCPKCRSSHDRGYLDGVSLFRCLNCGYQGDPAPV